MVVVGSSSVSAANSAVHVPAPGVHSSDGNSFFASSFAVVKSVAF